MNGTINANSREQQKTLKKKVLSWSHRIGVTPTQVRIQRMTRKWASCSAAGWISLAHDLADQPRKFQDYVIVHELLHLRVPNHGKLFKSLMSIYVPDWRELDGLRSIVNGFTILKRYE